ncbi:hypothetical protein B0H16DRAFT_1695673 [Mycena metata]|uniref:Uncharacterized protein n=1 Tax=Mycena metata TaxID=1033252 RepID=A0AAD7I6J4_9AGAR|nr:hypothetical protein B0H16DRAFT_1695673 [Mycena metata]
MSREFALVAYGDVLWVGGKSPLALGSFESTAAECEGWSTAFGKNSGVRKGREGQQVAHGLEAGPKAAARACAGNVQCRGARGRLRWPGASEEDEERAEEEVERPHLCRHSKTIIVCRLSMKELIFIDIIDLIVNLSETRIGQLHSGYWYSKIRTGLNLKGGVTDGCLLLRREFNDEMRTSECIIRRHRGRAKALQRFCVATPRPPPPPPRQVGPNCIFEALQRPGGVIRESQQVLTRFIGVWRPARNCRFFASASRILLTSCETLATTELAETRVGGVKIIFRLPTTLFNGSAVPPAWSKHPRLAYVEWFSAFKPSHEQHHHTYSVVEPWPRVDGSMQGSIIPLTDIHQTFISVFPDGARGDDLERGRAGVSLLLDMVNIGTSNSLGVIHHELVILQLFPGLWSRVGPQPGASSKIVTEELDFTTKQHKILSTTRYSEV